MEKQEFQLEKNVKALQCVQFPSHCSSTCRVPCPQTVWTCSLLHQNASQCIIHLLIISLLTGDPFSQLFLSKYQLTLQDQIQMPSLPWNLPRHNSLPCLWTFMVPCVYFLYAIGWWDGITWVQIPTPLLAKATSVFYSGKGDNNVPQWILEVAKEIISASHSTQDLA